MANDTRPRRTTRPTPDITPEMFRRDFDEELTSVLDIGTWQVGRDIDAEYARIEREVAEAVAQETSWEAHIRDTIHPMLAESEDAPPGAGRHTITFDEMAQAQRGLLFPGAVEACDGVCQSHDTLALTIYHQSVCLMSYRGDGREWRQQLIRRDMRRRCGDRTEEVVELLRRRGRRAGLREQPGDELSELARRGLTSFAERAVLARNSSALWRLGHGSPAPLEILCAYFTDVVIESIKVLLDLVEHGRFVFVGDELGERGLMTIGQGLRPMEYVIVGTLRDRIAGHLERWSPYGEATVDTTWDGEALSPTQWVARFRDEIAPQVVYGLYRATALSPPQLFYARADLARVAATIALADSTHLETSGFPLLLQMARHGCRAGGGPGAMARHAYVAAGAPHRYGEVLSEEQ